jgi:hypothetical protein
MNLIDIARRNRVAALAALRARQDAGFARAFAGRRRAL